MQKFQFSRAVLCLGLLSSLPANAGDISSIRGQQLYEPIFQMSGVFLKAGYICADGDTEMFLKTALKLQTSTEELKAIARAYPSVTEEWMMRGAKMMNERVMKEGIGIACFQANVSMHKVIRSWMEEQKLKK